MIRYYDGHVHYNHRLLDDDRKDILAKDYQQGVIKALNCASTMNSNFFMRKDLSPYVNKGTFIIKPPDFHVIRPKGPEIKFAIGKDPLFVGGDILSGKAFQEERELIALADFPDVKAVKTGLNYTFGTENASYQKHWFQCLVHLALAYNLPLNLNVCNAWEDALHLLQTAFECKQYKGVILDWSQDADIAKRFMDMGFLLGIGSKVFYNLDVRETVKQYPLEMMVLESDFPRSNKKLPEIAQEVAALKNIPLEKVAEITFMNGEHLYG